MKPRPLTHAESTALRRVTALTGALLDNYDDIRQTSAYRQRLKQAGSTFFAELDRAETAFVRPVVEGLTSADVYDELLPMYAFLNAAVDAWFAAAEHADTEHVLRMYEAFAQPTENLPF